MKEKYLATFKLQLRYYKFFAKKVYRIEQNFGGKKFWRHCDFEILVEKLWQIQGLPAFSL